MTPDQLDIVLYGKILEGKGPWPQGPKTIERKKLRAKMHEQVFGNNKCPNHSCPVCRKFIINI